MLVRKPRAHVREEATHEHELSIQRDHGARKASVPDLFRLYRVFNYAKAPRIYVLEGSMAEACDLQPTEYLAAPSSSDSVESPEA